MYNLKQKMCCIIGSGKIEKSEAIITYLKNIIKYVLDDEHIFTFVFGGTDRLSSLCYKILGSFRDEYWGIEKIHIITSFDELEIKQKHMSIENSDRIMYSYSDDCRGNRLNLLRNKRMIDICDVCIIYYDEHIENTTKYRKSNISLIYEYAKQNNKIIFNLCDKNKPLV